MPCHLTLQIKIRMRQAVQDYACPASLSSFTAAWELCTVASRSRIPSQFDKLYGTTLPANPSNAIAAREV